MSVIDAYIFDVESFSDSTHRQHFMQVAGKKDFDSFFAAAKDDKPIPQMVELIQTLLDAENDRAVDVLFVSGRPEKFRDLTTRWISDQLLANGDFKRISDKLFMRPNGNFKPDTIVKPMILSMIREAGFRPVMAFEERALAAKIWRDLGVPCLQTENGTY